MIYVSSSCVPATTIREAVETLAREGFRHIELSGGTKYYARIVEDLLELQDDYGLSYLIHNYFPPPKDDFVLNLASLDDDIYRKTVDHLEKALNLTSQLGCTCYSLHAGFFVDRPSIELGKTFGKSELFNKEKAIRRFCNGYEYLKNKFENIKIYIENNCYSASNYNVYGQNVPFMFLTYQDCIDLHSRINFHYLLDIAHLQVSSNSLEISFEDELGKFLPYTDYVHLSNNDTQHDQNLGLDINDSVFEILSKFNWCDKFVTLEVYEGIEEVKNTFYVVSLLKKQGIL